MFKALTYNGTAFLSSHSGFKTETEALDFIIDLSYNVDDTDELETFLFNSSVIPY